MSKQILCLMDYGPDCKTGYATVSRNMVKQLKAHYGSYLKLDIMATNYFGKPYNEYEGTVQVMSAVGAESIIKSNPDKIDDFGRMAFLSALKETEYDGIYMLQDLAQIVYIVPLLKQMQIYKAKIGYKYFTSVVYFPVDGKIHTRVKNPKYVKSQLASIPKEEREFFKETICPLDELDFFDHLVTYTLYAKNEILKQKPSLESKLSVIYHGINTADFYPITGEKEKEKFRNKYFGNNANKYIVGCINRNQYRKDIPTAIFGFIEAKKNWPKEILPAPFLYLHMDPEDSLGWRLRDMLSMTNLVEGKDYMFPKDGDANSQVDIATLNSIINSIDVYLSTALGGGWELSFTECMACKIPCIVPNHTSLGEIGGEERASLLEEFLPVCNKEDNMVRQMCQYEEVGESIIKQGLLKEILIPNHQLPRYELAYQWITQFTWEAVCENWIRIFNKY